MDNHSCQLENIACAVPLPSWHANVHSCDLGKCPCSPLFAGTEFKCCPLETINKSCIVCAVTVARCKMTTSHFGRHLVERSPCFTLVNQCPTIFCKLAFFDLSAPSPSSLLPAKWPVLAMIEEIAANHASKTHNTPLILQLFRHESSALKEGPSTSNSSSLWRSWPTVPGKKTRLRSLCWS